MHRHFVTAVMVTCVSIGAMAAPAQMDDTITMSTGIRYEVELQQRIRSDLGVRPAFGHWGTAMPRPVACAALLKVSRGNQAIPVPAKLYFDLCSVNRMWLEDRKGAMVAIFQGGDGIESFKAEFVFVGARLTERLVRDGPSNKVLERTLLSSPAVLN